MNYIIDGFNLAFKIESIAKSIKNGDTNKAIKQLIYFVQSRLNSKGSKVIIVFDGQENHQSKKSSFNGASILFSTKPQTADDIIRDFIRKTSHIKKWTVISSDNEILFTAKDHGANTMKSVDFINMRKKNGNKNNSSIEKEKNNPENIDVEYWQEIFNSGKKE